jgi:hypothetical protein
MPKMPAILLIIATLNRNRRSGGYLAGAARQLADCMRAVTVRRGECVSPRLLLIRTMPESQGR